MREIHAEGETMKSTQIHQDKVGEQTISTVFIEGGTEPNVYRYFETAVVNISKCGRKIKEYEVVESGVPTREQADEIHASTMELAEKAQAYRER